MSNKLRNDASFSSCGRYRYSLVRRWDFTLASVLFIGLNPSTADATTDDPTVRRCISFAKSWGFGSLLLANLFALRSPDPRLLTQFDDPIGPDNDSYLLGALDEVDRVVLAWGVQGRLHNRDRAVFNAVASQSCYCLGLTKDGYPRHPLYVPGSVKLKRFKMAIDPAD